MRWYWQQVEWKEGHSCDNPDVSTPGPQAWYLDMRKQFPPLNGPYASDDVDNPKIIRSAARSTCRMPADGLERAAELATQNPYTNPRPVDDAGMPALLRNAWSGKRPE